MINFPESEDIYFPKTKEYFKEVVSTYYNSNYRSSVVMLYSVVICDILYKLKELDERYNNGQAKNILQQVDKSRKSNEDSSAWERQLIDRINKDTKLLDDPTQASIKHLKNIRNLSAHPSVDDEYILYEPSKETTVALIREVLINLLIKPPIFIGNIVDMLTEDLKETKDVFKNDKESLNNYLDKKYFSKMNIETKYKIFKTFWKLCFVNDNDECKENIDVNINVLEYLLANNYDDIITLIGKGKKIENIPNDDSKRIWLCRLLAKYTIIYKYIDDYENKKILSLSNTNDNIKLLSWFTKKNKQVHIQELIDNNNYLDVDKNCVKFSYDEYAKEGLGEEFLNYIIKIFNESDSYNTADNRCEKYILQFLDKFNSNQFTNILEGINNNSQIYNRRRSYSDNNEILKYAISKGVTDYEVYPNLSYDKSILGVNEEKIENNDGNENSDVFAEMPF